MLRTRIVPALVALLLAAGGLALLIRAFPTAERPAGSGSVSGSDPISDPSPAVVDARVTHTIAISDFPNAVAIGEGGVWVGAGGIDRGGDIVRIHPRSGEVVARIPIRHLPGWEVGGGGIATGLGSVWVIGDRASAGAGSDGCCEAIVQRIDPATNELAEVIEVGPGNGADVWVDAKGIWVLLFPPGHQTLEVVRLDPVTHEEVARIPVPGIWSQTVFGSGGSIWVVAMHEDAECRDCVGEGTLYRIDPTTNQVTETSANGIEHFRTTADDASIWVGTGERIIRIDPGTAAFSREHADEWTEEDCCSAVLSDGSGGIWIADGRGPDRVLTHADDRADIDLSAEIDKSEEEAWEGIAYAYDPENRTIWVVHYKNAISSIQIGVV